SSLMMPGDRAGQPCSVAARPVIAKTSRTRAVRTGGGRPRRGEEHLRHRRADEHAAGAQPDLVPAEIFPVALGGGTRLLRDRSNENVRRLAHVRTPPRPTCSCSPTTG